MVRPEDFFGLRRPINAAKSRATTSKHSDRWLKRLIFKASLSVKTCMRGHITCTLLQGTRLNYNCMKILIAEDESSISMQYNLVLRERGHDVTITEDGVECLSEYVKGMGDLKESHLGAAYDKNPPFDLVILDYRMPKMDGLEAAKQILERCPSQRLMFASAYTAQTLMEAVKSLHKVVELLQKPFDLEYFVDSVEDKVLYEQLERLNVRVRALKDYNITHSQLLGLLTGVQKLHEMVLRD